MNSLRLLILEDDTNTCQSFTEYIDTLDDVTLLSITNNAFRALELAKEYQPDAVIVDLELNQGQGNGLEFLRELKCLPLTFFPYILITTNNSSGTTYDFARQLGADFIMSKHQDGYTEKQAIDFLMMMREIIKKRSSSSSEAPKKELTPEQTQKKLVRMINTELNLIGISPKAIGYTYLTDAILLALKGTKSSLCPVIGQKYHKTASSVERAMQNAINRAWCTSDIEDLLLYYTARINSEKGVPTLTEFVYYYANKIGNKIE